MRWTFRISVMLFLAWAIFMISPFVALYDLAKAVEAKDLARITERVNFNAVRTSLSRQILGEYLDEKDVGGLNRDVATGIGTAALNPVIEELVTPEALAGLLEKGVPQQIAAGGNGATPPLRVDLGSIEDLWRVFISSESQGFRSITIPLPATEPKQKQFRLTMRIRGTTWRLSGIELPQALREELIQRVASLQKQ
jgi:hypothetical protein